MNKAMIIGNLTKDVELTTTSSGTAVCKFTVAVPRMKDETDFIPVVAWKKLAELCGQYLAKGKKVAVFGRIQTGSYTDKNGNKRYTTDVVADKVEFLSKSEQKYEHGSDTRDLGYGEGHNADFEPLDDEQMPF